MNKIDRKVMKKLISLLILVAFFPEPNAEAKLKGRLLHRTPWKLEVTTQLSNGGSTAVQLTAVKKNGTLVVLGTMTIAPGDMGTLKDEVEGFPESVSRIIIEVDPPTGGNAVVKVTQGLNVFDDPIAEDERFVYDLDPAPRFRPTTAP